MNNPTDKPDYQVPGSGASAAEFGGTAAPDHDADVAECMAFYDLCHPFAASAERVHVEHCLRLAMDAFDALDFEIRRRVRG